MKRSEARRALPASSATQTSAPRTVGGPATPGPAPRRAPAAGIADPPPRGRAGRPPRARPASDSSARRRVDLVGLSGHRGCARAPAPGRRGRCVSYSTCSPVPGCSKPRRTACSHCRSRPEALGQGRVGAVGQVADAGVLQRRHVHPDLVGAPGLELHLQQAGEAVRLEGLVVGDAVLAVLAHRELPVRGWCAGRSGRRRCPRAGRGAPARARGRSCRPRGGGRRS